MTNRKPTENEPTSGTGAGADRTEARKTDGSPVVRLPAFIQRMQVGPDATRNERLRATLKIIPFMLVVLVAVAAATYSVAVVLRRYAATLATELIGATPLFGYAILGIVIALFGYALTRESISGKTPLGWITGAAVGAVIISIPAVLLAAGLLTPLASIPRLLSLLITIGFGVAIFGWFAHQYRRHDVDLGDVDRPF